MIQPQAAPDTSAEDVAAAPEVRPPSWEPPCVLWEQDLVALTQVSTPRCNPGQDPNCPY